MRLRPLRIIIWLLLIAALGGVAAYLVVAPLPESLAAIIFTPTPTATSTPTPTPTSTPTPTHTPTPTPEPLSVSLDAEPRQAQQGDTVVVAVQSNREVELSGSLGEEPLSFVPVDGGYYALVGLSSWEAVGTRELSVEARSQLGEAVQVTGTVTVTYGQFPTELIDIPAEREYLLDSEIVAAEWERLAAIYDQFEPKILWQEEFGYPVQAITVTSPYGAVRQYETGYGRHAGVDLDGETGDPAFADAAGRVVLSEPLQVRGNTVILDHGMGVYSTYCHLSGLAVQVSDTIVKGRGLSRLHRAIHGYASTLGAESGWHCRRPVCLDQTKDAAVSCPHDGRGI
jgi:murein DD-endopeptidase MepM/ murein hydrolase activator NlpD